MLRNLFLTYFVSFLPIATVYGAEKLEGKLPEIEISEEVLGGTVIMIGMKHSLIINKKFQEALAEELGKKGRDEFYRDMILEKDPSVMATVYEKDSRKITFALLEQYRNILNEKSSEKNVIKQKNN